MWFKASAPGSLMLLGEYAVLNQGHALVAAIDSRMSVQLSPRVDTAITIQSQLGTLKIDLSKIEVKAPFQFVLTAIKKYSLPSGFDLVIESEFSDQMGFASSAAVTVALLKVLHQWLALPLADHDLILQAREIIREVQGVGSGADVAACVLGGVVAYRADPFIAEKLNYSYPISVVYSGSKTKTVDAIRYVQERFAHQPKVFQNICQAIDGCAQSGIQAVRANDHDKLGKIMHEQQLLMEQLGVSTPILNEIVSTFRADKNCLGVKISGSGLGDCVIALNIPLSQSFPLSHDAFHRGRGVRGEGLQDAQITNRGCTLE